ncbi:Thioredoxin [Lotmaria passim]
MLSYDNTQGDHTRALKKAKVDSPVISNCINDCSASFPRDGKPRSTSSMNCDGPLTPPHRELAESTTAGAGAGADEDDHNAITAEDVSSVVTAASSKSPSHEPPPSQSLEPQAEAEGSRVFSPTRPSASLWRSPTRLSGSSASTAISTAVSAVPLPVSTNGAVTTLRSLSQLELLVNSANTTSAREKTHPGLRLKRGESVMLLLYFDEASLRPLISAATAELSQMRVFTLNLAKLPPQDYEPSWGWRAGSSGGGRVVAYASAHAGASASTAAPSATPGALDTVVEAAEEEEEEEEEEVLVPAVHPMAVSAAEEAEASASADRERASRPSATGTSNALTLDEAVSMSSLSGDLQHVNDVISEKLRWLLSVDTILNPHAVGSSSDGASSSKREPLLFPAMIVWRAAGAPREEYPPAPPQTYSSQPSPTPAELFCDRMSVRGGPLVVKEATSIDQVHSLTLFRPVYTMENLFRTLVNTVAPSFSARVPGDKSRTVLYLGASWCPPCMRFVHEMPQFMREDLPSSVVCTVKADMDLAKPIYDFFKVEIIPTFIVLDNEVLMKCYYSLPQPQQRGTIEGGSGSAGTTVPTECLRSIQDAFAEAELARLQNSNRQLVSTFVSKHSQTLSFDEDF